MFSACMHGCSGFAKLALPRSFSQLCETALARGKALGPAIAAISIAVATCEAALEVFYVDGTRLTGTADAAANRCAAGLRGLIGKI
jgi:hypothetical protein